MLGALAGIASDRGVTVHGMEAAAVSYPGFVDDMCAIGAVTA
jgi:3-phosphoshikimate 1-carboxyvinyltransferase